MPARKAAEAEKSRNTVVAPSGLEPRAPQAVPFPIVALGASAGGLEAFEQFFRSVPANSGMAFVLVQHLDPAHASILTSILQRCTAMTVFEVEDQMVVAPNCVYVIPPNRDMAIFHGVLQLSVPRQPRGHRLPIDAFFRSLAEEQGERAIGVLLSGTGTDGTQGLRAILGAGGISFVQEPSSAKYSGMPASAIHGGHATYVLPPEKMPEAMLAGSRPAPASNENLDSPSALSGMNRIFMLLRTGTGNDFSLYKKSTIRRRIERRMSLHNIETMELYARYLREHPPEVQVLFKELLINVTSFFRDPEAFGILKTEVLPKLLQGKGPDYLFRVWVAGCATGEEAYSIAILLREYMEETRKEFKVQIYATDLDEDAIVVARAEIFPPNIAQDLAPERLRRFFLKVDSGYQVKREIREMLVFATQNVIKDPPFTRMDFVSCRNLMIYLEPELQKLLIPTFHYALKPGGVLFVSPSESTGNHPDLFTPISRKWKIYQAAKTVSSARTIMAGNLAYHPGNGRAEPEETMKNVKATNFAEITKRVLLQSYAPASVVTDMGGNILYVHGDTGKYLRPAPGHATLNVIDMAREGLQTELRNAIRNAATQRESILNREISLKADGSYLTLSYSVRPLPESESDGGTLLVSFQDVPRAAPPRAAAGKRGGRAEDLRRVTELERDLSQTKDNLQGIIEEQQASNEELKSTNEELQSTNEELQSTNEELETSKEELQSVNEELITLNSEMQSKIEQLASMQNDMKNLLDNTSVGIVFLDENMVIRRFTRDAAKAYRLIATDVGRPLRDIKSDLEGEDLVPLAQTVLETLIPCEREMRLAGGALYLVRIQPYRTLSNTIEGVVLIFTDISKRIEAEEAMREARELAEAIVDTVREPLVVLDHGLKIISASKSFYERFGIAPEAMVGRMIYESGDRSWDVSTLRSRLETMLLEDRDVEDFALDYGLPGDGKWAMHLHARHISRKAGAIPLILLAIEAPVPKKE